MLKYKDTYFVIKNKDSNGNWINKNDTYIQCVPTKAGIQIYRYSSSLLAVQFNSVGIANNRIKELIVLGVQLTTLQCGSDERTYKFKESEFPTVADIVGARKRVKRDLTDEQREELRIRLQRTKNLN